MQREVYADLYFLINASMDLLSLMITASLLHRRVKRLRALLASAVGGTYAVLTLLVGTDGIVALLADCALAGIMCAITFATKKGHFSQLLKCIAVQFLTSMVLGGIMTALYTLLNRMELPFEALQGDGISVWLFVILSAIAGVATVRGGRLFGLSKTVKSVSVCATFFEKELHLSALVDSGNLLRDPISGKSVIVADRKKLLAALPAPLAARLAKTTPAEWLSDPAYAHAIRLIPTKTATGECLLPALTPQALEIDDGKSTYPADYLIAPADLGESANGFDAIVPSE